MRGAKEVTVVNSDQMLMIAILKLGDAVEHKRTRVSATRIVQHMPSFVVLLQVQDCHIAVVCSSATIVSRIVSYIWLLLCWRAPVHTRARIRKGFDRRGYCDSRFLFFAG